MSPIAINHETQEPLVAALNYADLGWPVLQVYAPRNGRCSCGNPNCESVGKHPCIRSWPSRASTDGERIHEWFNDRPDASVGILTGSRSGLVVLDIDPRNGGVESLRELLSDRQLPTTLIARTGGGGRHVFFALGQNEVRNRQSFRPGLDIKGERGFVVAPPSIHASGQRYRWERIAEPAPIPAWLLQIIQDGEPNQATPRDRNQPGWVEAALAGVDNGDRNITAASLVGHFIERGLPDSEIESLLLLWDERNEPRLGEQRIRLTVDSVRRTHERNNSPMEPERIEFRSFAQILTMPRDETPPIISGILRRGGSLLITGPSAIGKSTMVLELCLCLASGRPFLGEYEIPDPQRVLLLQAEDSFQTFQDRLRHMAHDWTGEREQALHNIITPWHNGNPRISRSLTDLRGEPSNFVTSLKDLIERSEANVLIFDPLISFHNAQENDNVAMRKVLDIISDLADEYDLTVVLTHHHGKGDQEGYYKSRGATAIIDWARSILTLTKVNPRQGGDRRHLIRATWTKTSEFALPGPLTLEMLQGETFMRVNQTEVDISPEDVATVLRAAENESIAASSAMIEAIQRTHNVGRDKAYSGLARAVREGLVIRESDPNDGRRRIFRLPTEDEIRSQIS